MNKPKTRREERHLAKDYLAKAQEHLEAAQLALASKKPDSTIGLAILAAISANDALCLHLGGERNASQSHQDAIALLERVGPAGPDLENAVRKFSRILGLKNNLQYSPRRYTEAEAAQVLQDAERFLSFARAHLRI